MYSMPRTEEFSSVNHTSMVKTLIVSQMIYFKQIYAKLLNYIDFYY